MKINRCGCTRIVLLTRKWAIKIPNFCDGWKSFLIGLLANLQERCFAAAGWPELCPVRFADPLGFFLVMPRAKEMTDKEFAAFNAEQFCNRPTYIVPAEAKANSFGWLNGRIVAIDYG